MLRKISLCLFLGAFFYLSVPLPERSLSEKNAVKFYANQCDDEIRNCFLKAIKEAKSSIVLFVYSLNDPEIFKALRKKREEGIDIKIMIDPKNKKDIKAIAEMVSLSERKSPLMHQKILIVDGKKSWIGSANFTSSSMQMHDNLVVGIYNEALARSLSARQGGLFTIQDQQVEIFILPKEKKEGLEKIKKLIQEAKKSLDIAMFTWTHADLTQLVIDAKTRGLAVTAIFDENSSLGTSKKIKETLVFEDVNTRVNIGSPLLHHKCCYIDKETLILGSTNWTKSAFLKNDECIVIIYKLKEAQKKKMERLWHALRATSI